MCSLLMQLTAQWDNLVADRKSDIKMDKSLFVQVRETQT